jgi:hypothetical protein
MYILFVSILAELGDLGRCLTLTFDDLREFPYPPSVRPLTEGCPLLRPAASGALSCAP